MPHLCYLAAPLPQRNPGLDGDGSICSGDSYEGFELPAAWPLASVVTAIKEPTQGESNKWSGVNILQ